MPRCENCGRKWPWWDAFIKSWFLISGKTCRYCGVKQYVTPSSRRRMGFLSIIPVAALLLMESAMEINIFDHFYITAAVVVLVVAFLPFSMELTSEKQSLW